MKQRIFPHRRCQLCCVILCITLLFTLFSGCGSTAAASSDSASTVVSQPASSDVDDSVAPALDSSVEVAASEVSAEDETVGYGECAISFPLDETETLSYWHDIDSSQLAYIPSGLVDDYPGYRASEAATNVMLKHVTAPSGMESDQFNLMCASQDYTDMIKNATTLYSNGAVGALDDEVIMDLVPLLEEYAPDYLRALDLVDGYINDASTDDSRIPTFVTVYVNGLDYSQGLWIRKDIFDSLGLTVPETYDEFTDALTALKNAGLEEPLFMDANGVFAKNLMAGGYNVAVSMLFGMGAAATEPFFQIDGKVTFGALESGWKDYVNMIRQWYENGLISSDFTSNSSMPLDTNFLSAITTGRCGVFVAPVMMMDYITSSGVDYNPDFELLAIKEPVLNKGDTPHFGQENQSAMTDGTCLSSTCSNPELAAAWCNYWYTDEGSMLANWGTEGETYVLDENGDPCWTDLIVNNPDGISKMTATTLYCIEVGTINYAATDTYGMAQNCIDALEIWKSGRDNSYDIPSTATFTSEESARYNELMGDISTYYQETLLRFITGDLSMDDYDAFVEQLKSMGVEECIEIKQAVLDRYLSR